ncbi:hypothetical protein [Streptomyces sp. NPDC053560]|uniref:hypothetical protein n=1 Tax=Streptomyces sp. NPDC053560 TaxID=3365711 RepID=UPI0037D2B9AD
MPAHTNLMRCRAGGKLIIKPSTAACAMLRAPLRTEVQTLHGSTAEAELMLCAVKVTGNFLIAGIGAPTGLVESDCRRCRTSLVPVTMKRGDSANEQAVAYW